MALDAVDEQPWLVIDALGRDHWPVYRLAGVSPDSAGQHARTRTDAGHRSLGRVLRADLGRPVPFQQYAEKGNEDGQFESGLLMASLVRLA